MTTATLVRTGTARVSFLLDPFDRHGRTVHDVPAGAPVYAAMAEHWPDAWSVTDPPSLTLTINGVECTDVHRVLAPGDYACVFPRLSEDEGLLLAVIIFVVTLGAGAPESVALLLAASYGYAFQSIVGWSRNDLPTGQDDGTNIYRWNEIQTDYRGISGPIPVIYGKHPTGGVVISYKVRSQGRKSFLFLLLAVSHGAIRSIAGKSELDAADGRALSEDAGSVNQVPLRQWGKKVLLWTRLGTRDQRPIFGFNDQELTYVYTRNLRGPSPGAPPGSGKKITYRTKGSVHAVQLNLSFPLGLYSVNKKGDILSNRVAFLFRFRVDAAATSWSRWFQFDKSGRVRDALPVSEFIEFPERGTYVLEIKRRTKRSTTTRVINKSQLDAVVEIVDRAFLYPGIALAALKIKAVEGLSGGQPNVLLSTEGRLVPIWDGVSTSTPAYVDTFTRDAFWCALDAIRNTTYGMGAAHRLLLLTIQDWEDAATHAAGLVFAGISTTVDKVPAVGDVVLSVNDPSKFKDGDRVFIDKAGNDDGPLTIGEVREYTIRVWPAVGFAHAIGSTVEKYHERYQLDAVYDTGEGGHEQISRMLATARARVVKFGNELVLIRAVTRSPVMLVSEGNVDEFQTFYINTRLGPNAIVLQYLDEDDNYRRATWEVRAQDVVTDFAVTTEFYERETLRVQDETLWGVTRTAQVERHGAWMLRVGRLIKRHFSWRMPLSGLGTRIGRVIDVEHHTVQATVGGLVAAAQAQGGSSLVVDREVVLLSGTTHGVKVRTGDDTVTVDTITSTTGTYAIGASLAVAGTWPGAIALRAPWAIGVLGSETVPAEITGWVLTRELNVEIMAAEYVEATNADT